MSMMRRQDELKAGHTTPTTEDCNIPGKLLDGIDCKILLDMGAGKSSMCNEVVDLAFMPETLARREGIPKPIPVVPKSVSQSQRRIPPFHP